MKNFIKNRLSPLLFIWCATLFLFFIYFFWGHSFISDIYTGKSLPIFNDVMPGRNNHDLVFYLNKADNYFYSFIFFLLLFSTIFIVYFYSKKRIVNFLQNSTTMKWVESHLNLVCLFTFLLFSVLFRLPNFFRSRIGPDEATYLLMAQSIVNGNLPYIELWDIKPPIAYLPHAFIIWLFGNNIVAIRLLGAICVALTAFLTYLAGKNIWNRNVGFLSGIISIIFISKIGEAQATTEYLIVALPLIGALTILVSRGIDSRSCFISGLLLSISVLMRMNLAYLVVIIGLFLLIYLTVTNKRLPIKYLAMYSFGGLVPLSLVILPYAIEGHLDVLYKALVTLPLQYANSQLSSIEASISLFSDRKFFGSYNAILWCGFIGGIIILLINLNKIIFIKKLRLSFIAIFLFGIFISTVKNGFASYPLLIAAVPFMSLPAGYFYYELFQLKYKFLFKFLFIVLLLMSSQTMFAGYKSLAYNLKNNNLYNDAPYRLANYLKNKNPNDEPVYLMIYHIALWLNNSKPISKYFLHPDNLGREYMIKVLVDNDATSASEIKKILDIKPIFIVKEENVRYLGNLPEAETILDENINKKYHFIKKIGKAEIYKRND